MLAKKSVPSLSVKSANGDTIIRTAHVPATNKTIVDFDGMLPFSLLPIISKQTGLVIHSWAFRIGFLQAELIGAYRAPGETVLRPRETAADSPRAEGGTCLGEIRRRLPAIPSDNVFAGTSEATARPECCQR
jgi:hypothetical protein